MTLDKFQRVVLLNQYRILALIDDENAESYRRLQTVMENGYEAHYDDVCGWMTDTPMTEEACQEVVRIMDMFRALRYSREKMADNTEIKPWQVAFAGFDGNNETRQMAYAEFFHNGGERFEELRGMNFNSHMPMMQTYRRMLSAWNQLGRRHELSGEEVARIANEAIHPENRG